MCGGVCSCGRCRGCRCGGLGPQRTDEFAEALEFDGGLARECLRVGVVPDAVPAPHDWVLGRRVTVFLLPEEGSDLPQVVVDQQNCDEQLRGREAAHAASSGVFHLFGAGVFESLVEGLDRLAGVGVERFPLFVLVGECLRLSEVVFRGERHGVLAADRTAVGLIDS